MNESSTLTPHQALKLAYAELSEQEELELEEVVGLATEKMGEDAKPYYLIAFAEWMKKKARGIFSNEKAKTSEQENQFEMFGFSEDRRMPVLRDDGS